MAQKKKRGGAAPRLKAVTTLIAVVAALVLATAVWSWWHHVYSSPSNTFDRMLNGLLSSTSLTKHTIQANEAVSQVLKQDTKLITAPEHAINNKSTISHLAAEGATITTENLGTQQFDYVRYTGITTSQRRPNGQAFDFSSVLNTWGKSPPGTSTSPTAQLYSQNILGLLPIGNVSGPQRRALLQTIKQKEVYNVNYATVKREQRAKRPTYTYEVTVAPVPYIQMLKDFAEAIGLTQLKEVDPNQYQNVEPVKIQVVVDVWSGQLLEIQYQAGQSDRFSSSGSRVRLSEPTDTIPVNELQTRLQSLN